MISYIFCKIFKILRVKNYIIYPDRTFKEINIKNIPDVLYFKKEGKYFNVIKVSSEIVNDTLVYNWINIEEIGNIEQQK